MKGVRSNAIPAEAPTHRDDGTHGPQKTPDEVVIGAKPASVHRQAKNEAVNYKEPVQLGGEEAKNNNKRTQFWSRSL